jgi:hypothetical protein
MTINEMSQLTAGEEVFYNDSKAIILNKESEKLLVAYIEDDNKVCINSFFVYFNEINAKNFDFIRKETEGNGVKHINEYL